MNQNRSCPGVPNRYSRTPPENVSRPKSIATVVVVLRSTPRRSSTGTEASVRASSVRSGRISLTAPTRVVLPTPKPPATRIFSVCRGMSSSGARRAAEPPAGGRSEAAEFIEHSHQDAGIGTVGLLVGVGLRHHLDQPVLVQVLQQDLHDPERQVGLRGEVGGGGGPPAQLQEPALLPRQPHTVARGAAGRDDDG